MQFCSGYDCAEDMMEYNEQVFGNSFPMIVSSKEAVRYMFRHVQIITIYERRVHIVDGYI